MDWKVDKKVDAEGKRRWLTEVHAQLPLIDDGGDGDDWEGEDEDVEEDDEGGDQDENDVN